MQNGESYAKVNRIPTQSSSIWGDNVGKFYSTWNPSYTHFPYFGEVIGQNQTAYENAVTLINNWWKTGTMDSAIWELIFLGMTID
jgi:hypothetical protein